VSVGSAEPVRAKSDGAVRSVARALGILEEIAKAGGSLGLRELAVRRGLPLATVHRLASTLVELGYVRRDDDRMYTLGPRLVALGDAASRELVSWAMPALHMVAERTGENANVAMLQHDRVVYVAQVPSRHPVRMFTEVGRTASLHCTAVGKALLAEQSDRDAREIIRRAGLTPRTTRTIVNLPDLLADLDRIRKRGYAVDDGEHERGVRCIAVAIRRPTLAAISVSAPVSRLPKSSFPSVLAALEAAVSAIAIAVLPADRDG
jgi:IclR family acetate operon transcriptional repressor